MALRKIVVEGDPVLKKKSRPVEKFDARLAELLDDMRQTLYSAEGVGLAAVQVGVLRRVVVVDVGDGLLELVNPEIIEAEGGMFILAWRIWGNHSPGSRQGQGAESGGQMVYL